MAKSTKNRFFKKLTNRYEVIVRNEADFAERRTFIITYAKAFSIFSILVTTIFVASIFVGRGMLSEWYDPDIKYKEMERLVAEQTKMIDSLEGQINTKDSYIMIFRTMLDPEYEERPVTNYEDAPVVNVASTADPIDNSGPDITFDRLKSTAAANLYLAPLKGCTISDSFNLGQKKYAILMQSQLDPGVRAIADGKVFRSDWDKDDGYVIGIEHANQLVSLYKGNEILLKKVGTFVQSGEVISLGEPVNSGAQVKLETWLAGEAIDPLKLITCNQ